MKTLNINHERYRYVYLYDRRWSVRTRYKEQTASFKY